MSESAFQIQQKFLAFKKCQDFKHTAFEFLRNRPPTKLNRSISYFSFWISTEKKIQYIKKNAEYKYLQKKEKETNRKM